jgi:hypothetical protein
MYVDPKVLKEESERRSLDKTDQEIVQKAMEDGLETVWDRLEKQQPQCGFGQLGLCCNRCVMGPCRIDPLGGEPKRGVCGATGDLITARNILDDLATGAAAHSDHGREVIDVLLETAEGKSQGYQILDTDKLKTVAAEYGIETEGREKEAVAKDLALAANHPAYQYIAREYGLQLTSFTVAPDFPPTPEQVAKIQTWADTADPRIMSFTVHTPYGIFLLPDPIGGAGCRLRRARPASSFIVHEI